MIRDEPGQERLPAVSLAADSYEKFLAVASIVLLACVCVAVARGQAEWARVPGFVWAHLVTIGIALTLTPMILLRRRGTRRHRRLGAVWAVSMMLTAILSLFIRTTHPGGWSVIHILSAFTLIQVPRLLLAARHHRVASHRRAVRAMVTGALLIAGFFTFPFNRMLGHWLFG